jgi:glyoxylase-like metal-dependent hydrolase (beta-lactamase superfamily II)
MSNALPDTISAIDGHYQFDGRAAAYLLQEGDEAAFVDNITRFSVPSLLDALKQRGLAPEQVKYAIVTHIHLDHSGGTAELVKECPNATVLCHPRAARHIIDPSRLVASARPIYGEVAFDKLYGEIDPVSESRVRIVEDFETVTLGNRTLTFLDTPGHARHHHSIHDSQTNTIFSGDAFGTAYRQLQGGTAPFMNYVCAPPEFDPQAAIRTIERLAAFGADRIMVTHFGQAPDIQAGADQQTKALLKFEQLAKDVAATDLDGNNLEKHCVDRCLEIIQNELKSCGLDPANADVHKWSTTELNITSQGVSVLASRIRLGKY